MSDKPTDIKWCPAQSGKYKAYHPEFKQGGEWKPVPCITVETGVPQPLVHGGVNSTLGLYGFAQANALAWAYAANAAAGGASVEVRTQPYDVVYDVKARKSVEP